MSVIAQAIADREATLEAEPKALNGVEQLLGASGGRPARARASRRTLCTASDSPRVATLTVRQPESLDRSSLILTP